MSNRRSFCLAALASLHLACSQGTKAPPSPTTGGAAPTAAPDARISGVEARRLVAQGALLLDVRSPEEFAGGHIEGARNVPVQELRGALATLPKDKPIVVYCARGGRATTAARELAAEGFDVRNLGGMASWNP